MKILLIGEYSRLHNSLKEGLQVLGHEVLLIGNGDLFKNFPVDINIGSSLFDGFCMSFIRKVFFKIFRIDIADYEKANKFKKKISKLKAFDVIQLINEDSLTINPKNQINRVQANERLRRIKNISHLVMVQLFQNLN